MRVTLRSPVREFRTPGSARGTPGNRRSYLNRQELKTMEIPAELDQIIDEHLARSEVLAAVRVVIGEGRCSIADGKEVVGQRFRERFPQLFETYRNLNNEE